jgi:hypothetical protein
MNILSDCAYHLRSKRFLIPDPGSTSKNLSILSKKTAGKLSTLHFLTVLGNVVGDKQSKSTSVIADPDPAFDELVTNNELGHFSE